MVSRAAGITRREYEERAGPNIAKPRWYKPVLRPISIRGVAALVKDYAPCPILWRQTYGRQMVERESAIYRSLAGVRGVTRYLGDLDAFAFAVEMIEGKPVKEFKGTALCEGFVDRFRDAVLAMHARGIVHLDLRQRRNVLVGPGGEPAIIDFASGIRLPPDSALFRLLRVPDLTAVAKLREKHEPDRLTEEERRLIAIERLRPLRLARRRKREARGTGRGP